MKDTMEVAINEDGKISFSIYEVLDNLPEDARKHLAIYFACDEPMWAEITRQVTEDYSSPNMDRRIHELRKAFITSNHFQDNVAEVVRHLLSENLRLSKEISAQDKDLYHWREWYEEAYGSRRDRDLPITLTEVKYIGVSQEMVQFYLDTLGIDLSLTQEQWEDDENSNV